MPTQPLLQKYTSIYDESIIYLSSIESIIISTESIIKLWKFHCDYNFI